jgi:hypothetical protein
MIAGAAQTSSPRGARRALTPARLVAWGWYSVFALPEAPAGGSAAGLVLRGALARAFWATWWTEDSRLVPSAEPDDYGVVQGSAAVDQAVGAAYDALRVGRGPRVFDASIGPSFAKRAYREGAPRRRSTATDFAALAQEGFDALGLTKEATPAEVRKAFVAKHPDHGGDAQVDMARLTKLYDAALAHAKARAEEQQRAAILAGDAPHPKRRRQKRDAALEQDDLVGTAGEARDLGRDGFITAAKRVARKVRRCAEQIAPQLGVPLSLYGLCMVAALGLVEALKAAGLPARIAGGSCKGGGHYWAEVPLPDVPDDPKGDPGSLLVDVTATQFGATWPAVLVLSPESKRREEYFRRAGGAFVRDFAKEMSAEQLEKIPERWWTGGTSK